MPKFLFAYKNPRKLERNFPWGTLQHIDLAHVYKLSLQKRLRG